MIIRDMIAAIHRFHEQPIPVAKGPEHDMECLTSFERKYRLEGRPIYRAVYMLS